MDPVWLFKAGEFCSFIFHFSNTFFFETALPVLTLYVDQAGLKLMKILCLPSAEIKDMDHLVWSSTF